jgi:stearoyl-CoA desaturase (delta-9 desaturase)
MNTSPRLAEPTSQTLPEKIGIASVIFLPFLGFIYGVAEAWKAGGVDWFYLTLMFVFYVLTGLGITIGYHRLFTHSSFQTSDFFRFLFAVLGTMAFQGNVIEWCTRHAEHHQKSDLPGDPHSPWKFGGGFWKLLKGFSHAHCMWLFNITQPFRGKGYDRLIADPVVSFVDRTTVLWMFLSAALPAAFGYLYDGSHGAWLGFVWGGLARIFLLHHVTWSINSYCHIWGKRRFRTNDHSRDSSIFGFLAFGEGFHNGHHAFPTSCRHGFDSFDLSYVIIYLMSKFKLAWGLNLPRPETLEKKRLDQPVDVR